MNWSGDERAGDGAVTVTVRSAPALLDDLERRLAAGEGFAVATLNLDHVVKLRRDPAFRAAYAAHTHVTADGRPIVWLSRLAGEDIALAAGSDLVDPVAALAARTGAPVAMLGSTAESLAGAAAELERRHPGFRTALMLSPPMGFDPDGAEADAAIAAVADSGARLCFLALGAPKQERFAARAAAALPGVGFLSVGAGLDFVSGAQHRAPGLVRGLAAEWLWRLASDPSRLGRRYAECFAVLPGLAARAVAARRRLRGETA